MKLLKKITILLCFLSLIAFISCSAEDKTGVKNNPPETIEIESKDFPTDLLGTYQDEKVASAGYSGANFNTKVSYDETTKKTKIEGTWLKEGTTSGQGQNFSIEKWKQTKKGGNPIKLEGESSDSGGGKYTIIYDYASGTLSGTYMHTDGTWSFNGKKIS